MPLADQHFEWEVELDSDFEVMRYLSGRASTHEEVVASHARRMAAAQNVDELGFWVGPVDNEFVGWWILQPAHGADQPDDPGVADWATGCCRVTGGRASPLRGASPRPSPSTPAREP